MPWANFQDVAGLPGALRRRRQANEEHRCTLAARVEQAPFGQRPVLPGQLFEANRRGAGQLAQLLLPALQRGLIGAIVYMLVHDWFADLNPEYWMFWLGIPVSALWALAAPSTQALITRQVGPQVQGRIQGALMSLVSLAGIAGPALFAGSFGYFIGDQAPVHLPSAPWFLAAGLLACAVGIAWVYAKVPAEAEHGAVAEPPSA